MCDSKSSVAFDKDQCIVYQNDETKMFASSRWGNLYKINIDELSDQKVSCLMFEKEDHTTEKNQLIIANNQIIFQF